MGRMSQEASAEDAQIMLTQRLIDALVLARERVTGDDLAAKQARRDKIKDLTGRMYLYMDAGREKPSTAELREVLGDDDRYVRHDLSEWGGAVIDVAYEPASPPVPERP
ncbi:MAG: hypothetical protein JWM19_961 [Actinomycetia bacterium]|nr:hypothetical protein [Actinomycetes bacterium]